MNNKAKKKYSLRFNVYGYIDGIKCGNQTILHLVEGALYNEYNAKMIVDLLNKKGD